MKNYDFVDNVPVPIPPFMVTIRERSQGVAYQENSPRVNGKLHLVPCRFEYSRYTYNGNYSLTGTRYGLLAVETPTAAQSPVPLAWDLFDEVTANAINRFFTQTSSYSANLLEMVATRQQTINMVSNTMRKIANAYRAVRGRDWRGLCGILGISYRVPRGNHTNPAEVWLEYVYGWRPLVQDVYTMVSQGFKNPEIKVRASAHGNHTSVVEQTGPYDSRVVIRNESRVTVVQCGMLATDDAALQAASQYGVTNPASLAWELLPFSFVVDWFLPVGAYLERLTASAGLRLYNCSTNLTQTTTLTASYQFEDTYYYQHYPKYMQGKNEFSTFRGLPVLRIFLFQHLRTQSRLCISLRRRRF